MLSCEDRLARTKFLLDNANNLPFCDGRARALSIRLQFDCRSNTSSKETPSETEKGNESQYPSQCCIGHETADPTARQIIVAGNCVQHYCTCFSHHVRQETRGHVKEIRETASALQRVRPHSVTVDAQKMPRPRLWQNDALMKQSAPPPPQRLNLTRGANLRDNLVLQHCPCPSGRR